MSVKNESAVFAIALSERKRLGDISIEHLCFLKINYSFRRGSKNASPAVLI